MRIHHVPVALEHVLHWWRRKLELGKILTAAERAWLPPRFGAGEVKLWHMCFAAASSSDQRGCVERIPSDCRGRVPFTSNSAS